MASYDIVMPFSEQETKDIITYGEKQYECGHVDGTHDGYINGYQEGHQEGYDEGDQDGYVKGYKYGLFHGIFLGTLMVFLGAWVYAPNNLKKSRV